MFTSSAPLLNTTSSPPPSVFSLPRWGSFPRSPDVYLPLTMWFNSTTLSSLGSATSAALRLRPSILKAALLGANNVYGPLPASCLRSPVSSNAFSSVVRPNDLKLSDRRVGAGSAAGVCASAYVDIKSVAPRTRKEASLRIMGNLLEAFCIPMQHRIADYISSLTRTVAKRYSVQHTPRVCCE